MKQRLKKFVFIELGLLAITIFFYYATLNANDFSGFIIMYPLFAMIVIGIGMAAILIAALLKKLPGISDNLIKAETLETFLLLAVMLITLYVADGFTNITLTIGAGLYIILTFLNNSSLTKESSDLLRIVRVILAIILLLYICYLDIPHVTLVGFITSPILIFLAIRTCSKRFWYLAGIYLAILIIWLQMSG